MTTPKLEELQREREQFAVTKAVAKLRDRLELDPAHSPTGIALMRNHWEDLSQAIRDAQNEARASGHMSLAGPLMLALDADCLAVIVLQTIIEQLGRQPTEDEESDNKFTALARKIGIRCKRQWSQTPIDEKERAILQWSLGKKKSTGERAKQRAEEILRRDWGKSERDLHLGSELIALARKVGLVRVRKRYGLKVPLKTPAYVDFTDEVRQALRWKADLEYLALPFHLPMIFPPNPWHDLKRGGYLTAIDEQESHLVKHRNNPKIIHGLGAGDYCVSTDAVNAIQETPWRLNKRILEVACEIARRGENVEVPAKVSENLLCVLPLCEDLKDKERFYFPYQLDFRGRAYCLPPLVNPQADDIGRSLLEFANGKRMGQRGAIWLAIHLANSFGECRGTLDERRAWTEKNEKSFLESAREPLGYRWWMEAAKPWRFLAACFEWRNFRSSGPEVESRLPVTVDGTCNGFQHLLTLV